MEHGRNGSTAREMVGLNPERDWAPGEEGAPWQLIPDAEIEAMNEKGLWETFNFLVDHFAVPPLAGYDCLPDPADRILRDWIKQVVRSEKVRLFQEEKKAVRAQQQNLKATLKGLERLAKRNAPPEATENLIPNLLSSFSIPKKLEEQYYQRFRHGLFQYYARRYRPIESFGEQT